jgi:hypothetical protein
MTRLHSAAAFLLLSGCTTFVAGERATPLSEGIEYSLPVPIVRVTPQANGTMDVKVEYLPDPDNTYVLRTESVVSSYTLDVQRENGMLKSVSLDSKSDAVAAAVAESAGKLIDLQAAAAVKEQEAAAAAAKEEAKALSEASLAVVTAQARFDTLTQANAGADKLLEAQLALDEAKAKRNHLFAAANGEQSTAFNSPSATGELVAAAPVLFRVVPDVPTGGVKLVAFEGPRSLPTSTAAKPETAKPDLSVTLPGPNAFTAQAGQPYQLKLKVNRTIVGLDLTRTQLLTVAGQQDRSSFILAASIAPVEGGMEIFVTLKPNTPHDTYFLEPVVLLPNPNIPGGEPAQATQIMIVLS